jgi:hypothetical protein
MTIPINPPEGWYDDGSGRQRWWDGAAWGGYAGDFGPAPQPPTSTAKPKSLAIAALIVGIIAFLTGLLPVIGIILGLVALGLGVTALVKKQSKALSITGMALATIAFLVSIVMTVGFATIDDSDAADRTPVATETAEPASESPTPEPSVEPTPEEPPAPVTPDLTTFQEIDDRAWALIAKDPDAHIGENTILYGSVTQFDSATGRCAMLVSTAATQKEVSYDYDQSVMAVSGDWETECPVFDPLVEDDNIKMWVSVVQSFSYDTQIGGNTTVPMVEVWQAELLPATEY